MCQNEDLDAELSATNLDAEPCANRDTYDMNHIALVKATNYIRKLDLEKMAGDTILILENWKRLFALREVLAMKNTWLLPGKYYGAESWRVFLKGTDDKLHDLIRRF